MPRATAPAPASKFSFFSSADKFSLLKSILILVFFFSRVPLKLLNSQTLLPFLVPLLAAVSLLQFHIIQ